MNTPENVINTGKNEFEVGTDIKTQIAKKMADEYFDSLSEAEIDALFHELRNEMYEYSIYDSSVKFKKTERNPNSWSGGTIDTPIWRICKTIIQDKYTTDIINEINRLLDTDEYKEKINQTSKDIIDYALDGYKKDMISRIRERLVDNVLDPSICYAGQPLRAIINEEIDRRFN